MKKAAAALLALWFLAPAIAVAASVPEMAKDYQFFAQSRGEPGLKEQRSTWGEQLRRNFLDRLKDAGDRDAEIASRLDALEKGVADFESQVSALHEFESDEPSKTEEWAKAYLYAEDFAANYQEQFEYDAQAARLEQTPFGNRRDALRGRFDSARSQLENLRQSHAIGKTIQDLGDDHGFLHFNP